MNRTLASINRQQGLSLIEILITVLILAIGLLGLAALQGFSLQANQGAYHRTQAVNAVYETSDFLRLNWTRANNIAAGAPNAEFERIVEWVANNLPGGEIEIEVAGPRMMSVTVRWQDGRFSEYSEDDESVTMVVRL